MIVEGTLKGLTRDDSGLLTCQSCVDVNSVFRWRGECSEAAAHVREHWLRNYIGPAHLAAAETDASVRWDGLEEWVVGQGTLKLPQSGADMPAFVVDMLRCVRASSGVGSTELQYVLDAILRRYCENGRRSSDNKGVKVEDILTAVYTANVMSLSAFERFKQVRKKRFLF